MRNAILSLVVLLALATAANAQSPSPMMYSPADAVNGGAITWSGVSGTLVIKEFDFDVSVFYIMLHKPNPVGATQSGYTTVPAYRIRITGPHLPSGQEFHVQAVDLEVTTLGLPPDKMPILKDPKGIIPAIDADGQNLILEMLRTGAIRDLNEDGKVDWADVRKMVTDFDGDGIENDLDSDIDGDGEKNDAENAWKPGWSEGLGNSAFDKWSWPDRDKDWLPDFLDEDGDGYPNFLETQYNTGQPGGADPRDPNKYPSTGIAYPLLGYGKAEAPYFQKVNESGLGPTQFLDGLIDSWNDDDKDGAWNWLELAEGTNPNSKTSFPDSNDDGLWDWHSGNIKTVTETKAIVMPSVATPTTPIPYVPPVTSGGGTVAPDPPPPPTQFDPPPAPTPRAPIQVVWPSGSSQPGKPNAGAVLTGGNMTSDGGSFTGIGGTGGGSGTNPGSAFQYPTGGSGGGTGGGTGTGEGDGEGNYRIVPKPQGTSTNWKGASGGTWEQRAGVDHAAKAADDVSKIGEKTGALRDAMGEAPTGSNLGHNVRFPIPWGDWRGGQKKYFDVPLLPDTSTWWGQQAEIVRKFLYMAAAIITGYIFIGKVWNVISGN